MSQAKRAKSGGTSADSDEEDSAPAITRKAAEKADQYAAALLQYKSAQKTMKEAQSEMTKLKEAMGKSASKLFCNNDHLMLEVVLQQYADANDCEKENKKSMVFCTVVAACMDKAELVGTRTLAESETQMGVCDTCQGIAGTQHKKGSMH